MIKRERSKLTHLESGRKPLRISASIWVDRRAMVLYCLDLTLALSHSAAAVTTLASRLSRFSLHMAARLMKGEPLLLAVPRISTLARSRASFNACRNRGRRGRSKGARVSQTGPVRLIRA
jgi:hypothetical protein